MDEELLDDYAFEGLDPFVRIVFSELMEHPDWMRVVAKDHCVEKVVRFDDGLNSPYFGVLIYLDAEERPIKKMYLYGTWVVADGDVSFVVSELSKGVFEYEVICPLAHQVSVRGLGHGRRNGDSGSCVSV
ncbi:hypothetical protein [Exiguobacterium sp. s141]|uniref:hypothetical protein n=1 Tax=Exiguobacterium sp. s141 TaxID=2751240 RepID=UPI001BE7F93A|nr:hypothetical protein [Exiguobacterium sp. s141]